MNLFFLSFDITVPPSDVIVVDGVSGKRIVGQIAGPYFLDQSNLTLKCIALDGK